MLLMLPLHPGELNTTYDVRRARRGAGSAIMSQRTDRLPRPAPRNEKGPGPPPARAPFKGSMLVESLEEAFDLALLVEPDEVGRRSLGQARHAHDVTADRDDELGTGREDHVLD